MSECYFRTPMQKEKIQGLKQYLSEPRNIVITNHVNPDGDAMGSALAMQMLLSSQGHNATVIVPNDYPHFLKWLPSEKKVVVFENERENSEALINASNLIVVLDYNALHRSGPMQETLEAFEGKYLMIDHHQQPDDFADWMISDTSKCSTAQMVYEFAEQFNLLSGMNSAIAENIYTGIVTDTGSFRFSSTTAATHKITAHLLELGVKPDSVYNNIFDANSVSRFKLLGCMLENMKVFQSKGSVILYLSEEDQTKHNFRKGDSEGFVNYGLSIKGITFAVFIREEKGFCKISLRSKGDLDVNQISRQNFNGGGHKNAAGGMVEKPLSDVIKIAESVIGVL